MKWSLPGQKNDKTGTKLPGVDQGKQYHGYDCPVKGTITKVIE